jgi:transposase
MYKLQQFCKELGIGTIYSLDTEKINDDRIGRALDCMHGSLLDIKAALIVSCIKEFDISLSEIHTDITNVLFEGSYENLQPGQLNVTYGYTKKGQDSRCKQVNFSLSVSADGSVPIWYEALAGNTTDSVAYLPHLNVLKDILGITSPKIYGDSKLVSQSNMIAFLKAGASFIGPASLDKNEKKRILKLWENGVNFQPLLLEPSKKPISFIGMETERKITSKEKNCCYIIRPILTIST